MYDVHNTHFTFLLMYFRGNFCPIEPNQNANGKKIQLSAYLNGDLNGRQSFTIFVT